MNWISRLILFPHMEDTLYKQEEAIASLLYRVEQLQLEHTRHVRALVEQFLIAHESGTDVRDALLDGIHDLDDEIARRSEHLV